MKIDIRTRHLELSAEASEEVRHRIRSALDRLSLAIDTVDVTLTDINGPRGGADKQCRLRVRGPSIPRIVIEHVGHDTIATVTAAAERTQQAVVRRMARRRTFVFLSPILATNDV